jgi:hypothetical protein
MRVHSSYWKQNRGEKMLSERRQQRSDHFSRALQLQLEAVQQRAGLNSLVLTGKRGFLLVGKGDASAHQELVMLSAKLAPLGRFWQGRLYSNQGCRTVSYAPVTSPLGTLHLCALGDSPQIRAELDVASRGVARILASPAARCVLR